MGPEEAGIVITLELGVMTGAGSVGVEEDVLATTKGCTFQPHRMWPTAPCHRPAARNGVRGKGQRRIGWPGLQLRDYRQGGEVWDYYR